MICESCKYCLPCYDRETGEPDYTICAVQLTVNGEGYVELISANDEICKDYEKARGRE